MKALITARFEERHLKTILPFFEEVKFSGYGVNKQKLSVGELKREIEDVDVLISEFETINKEVLDNAKKLKIIACCRNEPLANVDINEANKNHIPVIYPAGRNAVAVAEFTFGMLLSLIRNISKTDYLLKHTNQLTNVTYSDKVGKNITSEWSLDPNAPFNMFMGHELYQKKLGLVGYGSIGRQLAGIADGFNMEILISDPFVQPEALGSARNKSIVPLTELFQNADFVLISCKVTPQTTGMVNKELIGMMKKTAFFVNTARAAIVDYNALYNALNTKAIAGAALDVYKKEPIEVDNPLLNLDNVLLTPHLAGSAYEIVEHHSQIIASDLIKLLKGEKPKFILNPEVL